MNRKPADPRFSSVPTLFFGIGAQKAGTTWLHRYFRTHPEIATPALKETTYWTYVDLGRPHGWARKRAERFGAGPGLLPTLLRRVGSPFPSLRPEEMQLQARMLDAPPARHGRYADLLFHGHRGEPALGEISPNYALLDSSTFAEMAALSEGTRFFYILRDPVARTLSGLRMALDHGWLRDGAGTLDAAIGAALEDPEGDFAIRSSRYDTAVARLEAVVPRERIHMMFYETLFDQATIDGLTDFLGVGRHPAQTERRVLRGRKTRERPSAERIAALRATLAPVYEFAAERFGEAVPPGWRL